MGFVFGLVSAFSAHARIYEYTQKKANFQKLAGLFSRFQNRLARFVPIFENRHGPGVGGACGGVDDPKIGSRAEQPLRREGYRSGGWTLLDFGCVVVHIFSEEMRSFYSLDRLWSDAEKIDYKDFL